LGCLEGIVQGRSLRHILARVWEVGIEIFGCLALVDAGKVGNHHAGQRAHLVLAARDGDLGAVHVHFAVADVVEPGPGKDRIAVLRLTWNLEGE